MCPPHSFSQNKKKSSGGIIVCRSSREVLCQGHMSLGVREDWFSGGKGRRRAEAGVRSESLTNVDVPLGLPAVLQVVDKRVVDLTLQSNSLTTRAQVQWVINLWGFELDLFMYQGAKDTCLYSSWLSSSEFAFTSFLLLLKHKPSQFP